MVRGAGRPNAGARRAEDGMIRMALVALTLVAPAGAV